jgi:RNA polymerase sigma factor (sigma-70 family)
LTDNGFVSFFEERFGRIVILLVSMGASRADAEDATQEAMTQAWRKWDSIQEPAAWIRVVAVRAYIRQVRARAEEATPLESIPEPAEDPDLPGLTQSQHYVLDMLRGLPLGQRTVAALYYDGMTCEEIAGLTGKPASTVRSQLRHARTTLKELMYPGGT